VKQFEAVPWLAHGYHASGLYAVEFENGVVKVGRSANPRGRLESLVHQARIVMGRRVMRRKGRS
jgi:hypothetical protein